MTKTIYKEKDKRKQGIRCSPNSNDHTIEGP